MASREGYKNADGFCGRTPEQSSNDDTVSELPSKDSLLSSRDGVAKEAAQKLLATTPNRASHSPLMFMRTPREMGTSASTPRLGFHSMSPSGSGGDAKALLNLIRSEMELMEERVNTRIARSEKQAEQFRGLAITQMDEKLGDLAAWRSSHERTVSQLSGTMKGVREELQALFQRISQIDSRSAAPQQRSEDPALKVRLGLIERELQSARTQIEEHAQRFQALGKLSESQGRRLDAAESQVEVLLQNCSGLTLEVKETLQSKGGAMTRIMERLDDFDGRFDAQASKLEAQESKLGNLKTETAELLQAVKHQESRTAKLSTMAASVPAFVPQHGSPRATWGVPHRHLSAQEQHSLANMQPRVSSYPVRGISVQHMRDSLTPSSGGGSASIPESARGGSASTVGQGGIGDMVHQPEPPPATPSSFSPCGSGFSGPAPARTSPAVVPSPPANLYAAALAAKLR